MENNINYHPETSETTLRDYVRVLFRQKFVIMTTIITVCGTVFIGLKLKTNVYESKVKMLITAEKQVEATYYREMYGARNVQQTLTQSEIVKSNPVLGRAVRALTLDKRPLADQKKFSSPLKAVLIDRQIKARDKKMQGFTPEQRESILFRLAVEELKKNIKVEPIRDTNMFTISVKDYNPIGAAMIANVVSRSYVIFDLEQQLAELKLKYGRKHPTVNLIEDSIAVLNKTLSGEPIDAVEAIGPASVKIMEQASVALKPSGTPKLLTLILAVAMGIFLSVMLAFIFEYTDQTFKTPQDVERSLDLPFLGSIARKRLFNRTLVAFDKRLSAYGRSYQALSDQLYMLVKDKKLTSFLITSTLEGERSSIVIANLGTYMANMLSKKVLIIDANLRSPSMNRLFKLDSLPGLADLLEGKADFDEITVKKGENLSLIPAGRTGLNPLALLDSHNMDELMSKAKQKYEIIIIDAPNIKDHRDTAILSTLVDGIILVVDEGQTRRQVVKNATMNMNGKLENIVGVILNNRTFPIPGFVYDRV